MLIKIGYEIALRFPIPTPVIHLLHVHPSRRPDLVEPERLSTEPALASEEYYDSFGNRRGRLYAPAGTLRLFSETTIRDSGAPNVYAPTAAQSDISEIPPDALEFLLPSRYCEVDSELMDFAWRTFLQASPGWERVQAICDFVHGHLQFDYQQARADRTALEAFRGESGFAATSRTWQSRSAGASTFPPGTQPVIWATLECLPFLIRWTSAPGLRFICRGNGTPLMLGTTVVALDGC